MIVPLALALVVAASSSIEDSSRDTQKNESNTHDFIPWQVFLGKLDSERLLEGFEALNKVHKTEFAIDWHREIPFARTLYWMYGEDKMREDAVQIVELLNKGELMVAASWPGIYFPEKKSGDGIVATDFVVSTHASSAQRAEQTLGEVLYYQIEPFQSLPYEGRAEIVVEEFGRIITIRGEIFKKVANGMGLREAIDSSIE